MTDKYRTTVCNRFCGCCGDCLRCYGDGENCWWCTPDPDDPGGCPKCCAEEPADVG